jgi:hypothetical protein
MHYATTLYSYPRKRKSNTFILGTKTAHALSDIALLTEKQGQVF